MGKQFRETMIPCSPGGGGGGGGPKNINLRSVPPPRETPQLPIFLEHFSLTKGWFSLATESESESELKRFRPSENRKSESEAESQWFHFLLILLMTLTLMTPVKTRLSDS